MTLFRKIYVFATAMMVPLLSMWAAGPRIEWLSTLHDFGAFREADGGATASFRFINTGDAPLVVTGARANCGCTTPKFPREAIAPGDTASIEVTYDPEGRPGRFVKKVYVDTNTEPARSTLTIRGTVIGAPASLTGRYPVEAGSLRLAHPAALLGVIEKGHVKSVFEGAYNASTDTLAPIVTDVPRWLEVKTVPARVAPGEQVSFDFFVHADRIDAWDIVTDTVTVIPDPASEFRYRMPVVVTVNEDFSSLTDRQIAEAPVAKETYTGGSMLDLTGGQATITLTNSGKSPLIVRRIYSADKSIEIDAKANGKTVRPGKKLEIAVRLRAGGDRVPHRAVILLVTNDPLNPKISIPVIIN
ncbi:MAG: DUF1573 domain-containing protein [Muribaculaceae bacterium]|nr:DUF1573 domain-containing protein [Muribaculaceae bacterium]